MADTLVERLTGQSHAGDVNVDIGLIMPLDTLIGHDPSDKHNLDNGGDGSAQADRDALDNDDEPKLADGANSEPAGAAGGVDSASEADAVTPTHQVPDRGSRDRPAELIGYGPIPAPWARDLLRSTNGKLFLTRLFTAPSGQIVAGDEKRRRFPQRLARLIIARDRHCRDPFCDAPIRHLDHVVRFVDEGPTNLANGRGVCARGNYVKEMPGWHTTTLDDGLGQRPHTVQVTTPTGHTYTSRAPDPP